MGSLKVGTATSYHIGLPLSLYFPPVGIHIETSITHTSKYVGNAAKYSKCHLVTSAHLVPWFCIPMCVLQDSDGDRWIREVALGPTPKPVVYMKHMAKQVSTTMV